MGHILFIEPDRLLAKNVRAALKRAGHSVDWTVEPQAAINLADARAPDLIFLDLLLANRSGIEFLYELRSYPEWQNIPALVLSSLPEREIDTREDILSLLNIKEVLYKPTTSLDDITSAAERFLQHEAV